MVCDEWVDGGWFWDMLIDWVRGVDVSDLLLLWFFDSFELKVLWYCG